MNAARRVAAAAQFRVACKTSAPDRGETVDGAKKGRPSTQGGNMVQGCLDGVQRTDQGVGYACGQASMEEREKGHRSVEKNSESPGLAFLLCFILLGIIFPRR